MNDGIACLTNLAVLILLNLGAAGSWALSLTLPNVKRRGVLAGQIAVLAERTHNLSAKIDSSLRVLLRVQRLRLFNSLSKGSSWSPATSTNLDEVQSGVSSLDRQITMVERIDRIYDRITIIKADSVPRQHWQWSMTVLARPADCCEPLVRQTQTYKPRKA